ncbi:hypothetical protein [Shouchella miscanthi]|uniref:hypothetical protein n=1 Tax=Shouchella miscanthi TaxID=2598861 RepID=UPI00119E11CC|nr:hypothetical protein [Shouchella miscanthi]
MSNKTFFFRDTYTIKEMTERIFAVDFISFFKGYASYSPQEDSEVNKKNCYLGLVESFSGDANKIGKEIENCFKSVGRYGDKLNVKLYLLEDFINTYNEIKSELEDIVSSYTNIKHKDSLSQGLNDNFFITDFKEADSKLDLKFLIEQEVIDNERTVPVIDKKVSNIECRLYLNTGLVAIYNPDNQALSKINNVLSIVHLLFKKHSPRTHSVNLDEAQLIMTNLRLKGEISSPKYISDESLRVDIYGVNASNREDPVVRIVGESQLKIYELTVKALIKGHNCSVKIHRHGSILIDTYVLPEVLDSIIADLNWVILKEDYYIDYSIQLDKFIKKNRKAGLLSQRKKYIRKIEYDFNELINSLEAVSFTPKEIKLTTTILFNIAVQIINNQSFDVLKSDQITLVSNKYNDLKSMFSNYIIILCSKNKDEADTLSESLIATLHSLLLECEGDSVRVIETYEEWLTCQLKLSQ